MSDADTHERNIEGQTTAITTFSTVKWWGRLWLPVLFFFTRRVPLLTKTLRGLSFIHFARWCVIDELPYNGEPQRKGKLRYPHLFFESNFNGGWEEYIDAFAHKLGSGMRAFWGSSYGFPGPLPTAPFKAYIRLNETEADHYHSAYPEATSTMVQRALKLSGFEAAPQTDASPNVSGQSYAFMAMTPIKPGAEMALTYWLRALEPSPFEQLGRTHFARFVVVKDFHRDPVWKQRREDHLDLSYLIFTSNFDGDLDSYLDELCALPEAASIWDHCIGDTHALKSYLLYNQIPTGIFFAAYGGATVDQVHAALAQYPPETSLWPSKTPTVRIHVKRAVEFIREAYHREYKPGTVAKRDQHAEEYGTIKGTLVVSPEPLQPLDPRQGIFAHPGAEYDIVARISPNGSVPWPLLPPMGLGLKVLNVNGPLTQDFLFGNTSEFFCANAADAVDLVIARSGGNSGLIRYFLPSLNFRRWRLRELRNMLVTITRRDANPLGADYFTQSAMRYGSHFAKLSLLAPSSEKRRAFKDERYRLMLEQLVTRGATFRFSAQIQADSEQPVNDPTRAWSTPFVTVAELRFPPQAPISGEHLEFTLAHTLPEHEAIDEISETRIAVYDAVSEMRHGYNHQPREEPLAQA